MTALPAAADFTGAAVTQGGFKTAITAQRDFLAGLLGADGAQATALATLGAVLNGILAKTAAYIVVAGDRGKLIDATGTWTLTLTAAATLGAGFAFAVKNSGSGSITVDPNGSELIDGAATITLAAGESCMVFCDGAAWKTVSKAAALTAAAIIAALAYTPAPSTALNGTAPSSGSIFTPSSSAPSFVGTGVIASYTKIIEFYCPLAGSVTTYMGLYLADIQGAAYARIYKNGAAIGTERSTMLTTPIYYEESFSISAGDLLQVYARGNGNSVAVSLQFKTNTGNHIFGRVL